MVRDGRVADAGSGSASDRGLHDHSVADRARVVDAASVVDSAGLVDGAAGSDGAGVTDSAVVKDGAILADAAGSPTVKTEREVYSLGEAVVVAFSGFPGNASDWITIVAASTADDQYDHDRWFYTEGQRQGALTFDGLQTPGAYEARGYFNWDGDSSYTVRSRHRFTVAP